MPFRFRKFEISDNRSTMKVGTDAVLLGAWTDVTNARNALDIGTGCGIIAVMLAQRSPTLQIEGIDIDGDSVEQARENAAATPWHSRLRFIKGPVQGFSPPPGGPYDLIVSNPPFFTRSLKSVSDRKNRTRHDLSLGHGTLIGSTVKLLAAGGILSVILPVEAGDNFISGARKKGLNLSRLCRVYPRKGKRSRRIMLELVKDVTIEEPEITFLEIMDEKGEYTEQYRKLTNEFYLFI